MSKLYILHGLFGSGKSTWAKKFVKEHPNIKIVNLDAIRYMFEGQQRYVIALDNVVVKIAKQSIIELLFNDFDVIVDCGNLTAGLRERWTKHLRKIEKVLVLFPTKDEDWHVDNRMKDPKGQTREYWEDYYNVQEKQMELPEMSDYDEVIQVKEWKDE